MATWSMAGLHPPTVYNYTSNTSVRIVVNLPKLRECLLNTVQLYVQGAPQKKKKKKKKPLSSSLYHISKASEARFFINFEHKV